MNVEVVENQLKINHIDSKIDSNICSDVMVDRDMNKVVNCDNDHVDRDIIPTPPITTDDITNDIIDDTNKKEIQIDINVDADVEIETMIIETDGDDIETHQDRHKLDISNHIAKSSDNNTHIHGHFNSPLNTVHEKDTENDKKEIANQQNNEIISERMDQQVQNTAITNTNTSNVNVNVNVNEKKKNVNNTFMQVFGIGNF